MSDPDATRAYGLPSCGSCLRIANSHGFGIGITTDEGRVEAFTHTDEGVTALVYTPHGFVASIPLATLEDRRMQ